VMLTIEEIKSDIERLESRLAIEETKCKNTRFAIYGAKRALKMMESDMENKNA